MTFQSFVVSGRSYFDFGESREVVSNNLKKYTLHEIDASNGIYAIYSYGVEYLFDNDKLCLVQYEISRVRQVYICTHKITEETSLYEFIDYLSNLNVTYRESSENEQIVLVMESGVKIYFDSYSHKFITALKSW